MKEFFWAIIAVYIMLYFYAAWLYDGFSVPFAVGLFAAVCAQLVWWRKRKTKQAEQQPAPLIAKPDVTPLSLWRSPIPYMLFFVGVVIVTSVWL